MQTLGDVLYTTQIACQQLRKLGIFESVQVILDAPQDGSSVYNKIDGKEVVDVIIDVKETNRITARTFADMETHEARMVSWSA